MHPRGEKQCYSAVSGCAASVGCASVGKGSSTAGPLWNTLDAKKGRYSTASTTMPSSTLVQSST